MNQLTTPRIAAAVVGILATLATTFSAADSSTGFRPRSNTSSNERSSAIGQPEVEKSLSRPSRPITPNSSKKGGQKRGALSLWKTLGALLFVVGLIVLGAKFLGKHAPKFNGGIPPEAMEVLGKRTVDQKQVIHLIRLGSRIMVIGGSPNGLQTLAEITDPVEVDYLAGMCRKESSETPFTQGFLALFRRQPVTEQTESLDQNDSTDDELRHDVQTQPDSLSSNEDRLTALRNSVREDSHA